MTRQIQMGEGGWINPDYHLKCGAKDPEARQLEPVHFSCPTCVHECGEILQSQIPAKETEAH